MADYTFTLEGGDELLNMLKTVPPEAAQVVGQAILEEATNIFNKSQILVPVDTGALRGSGGVSAPIYSSGGVAVDVFYGGPAASYALIVHEIQEYYHNPPTQAKYLEQPFMEALPNIQKNMASRIINLIQQKAGQ